MQSSAELGSKLSVRLCVTLHDHIVWNSLKIIKQQLASSVQVLFTSLLGGKNAPICFHLVPRLMTLNVLEWQFEDM